MQKVFNRFIDKLRSNPKYRKQYVFFTYLTLIFGVSYIMRRIYKYIKRNVKWEYILKWLFSKSRHVDKQQKQDHLQTNENIISQTVNDKKLSQPILSDQIKAQYSKQVEITKPKSPIQQDLVLQPEIQQIIPKKNANRGLRNLGNTCYINCVLQCLHKSKHFNQNLSKDLEERGENYLFQNNKTLTYFYNKMRQQLWQEDIPYQPFQIKRKVAQINYLFQKNQQNDASEFLSTFFYILNQQLQHIPSGLNLNTNDEIVNKPVIQNTFTGQYKTCYICKQCEDIYKLEEQFNIHYIKIPVETENSKLYTLQDCLNQFKKPEQLRGNNMMTCNKCGVERDTDKTMQICKTNKILVICIQRFSNGQKDYRKVEVPYEIMQQNKIYKLYGACLHFGGLDGGHYTAICLNYKTNKWVDFNDSRCTQIDRSSLDNAYLLFYEQYE